MTNKTSYLLLKITNSLLKDLFLPLIKYWCHLNNTHKTKAPKSNRICIAIIKSKK